MFCQENVCHGGKKNKGKKTLYNPAGLFAEGGEPEADCRVYEAVFLVFVGS